MNTPLKTRSPSKGNHKEQMVLRGVGELRVLDRANDYEFNVILRVMRNGYIAANNWEYRNLEEYYTTFAGRPILCAYVGNQIGDGHNMREKTDQNGKRFYTFTDPTSERIVGALSEDINDLTLVEDGGYTWLEAKGKLWSFYAKELVDKIVQIGRMDVSAETLTEEEHKEDGVEVFDVWQGMGVTVLGDYVDPAIPGADIAKLQKMNALMQEFEEAKLRVASLLTKEDNKNKPCGKIDVNERKSVNKGVRTEMSKKQREELQAKCAGFRVCGASEDGKNVVLLSASGDIYTYSFQEDGEFVPENLKKMSAVAVEFAFGEDASVAVNADDLLEPILDDVKRLSAQVDLLKSEKTDLDQKIVAMNEAEQRRRKQAAKDTITTTLSALNANRENGFQFNEETCAAVAEAVENGEYADMTNESGDWCGADAVARDVKACCMDAQQKMDQVSADNKHNSFSWKDSFQKNQADSGNNFAKLFRQ